MGSDFYKKLTFKIISSLKNDYTDNFDELRFVKEKSGQSLMAMPSVSADRRRSSASAGRGRAC